jgi:HlyD family secretion protein
MRVSCPVPLAALPVVLGVLALAGCGDDAPADRLRLSGHVEATEVRVAAQVGGRVLDLRVDEGSRVAAGDLIARLDTADAELLLARAEAERQQADAQLRLLLAGSRTEDIRQAEAQVAAAVAELAAARAELDAARTDLARFEDLLKRNSGSRKQRDDAATREQVADQRSRSGEERVRAARETLRRLRAGARPQEIEAARARLAAVEAQIATIRKSIADAAVAAPAAGVVTQKLVERGELIAPGTAIVVLTDLDHAWANVYVDEPLVPRIRLGQRASVFTDAGGAPIPGTVTFVSPRAEFTPRNVQTAEERSKLVYRVKVGVDNRDGVLKPGMPVEAELPLEPTATAGVSSRRREPSRSGRADDLATFGVLLPRARDVAASPARGAR